MMRRVSVRCSGPLTLLTASLAVAQTARPFVDTFPDTWVATDALGRVVRTHEQVGPPRDGKFVGIFYFLWNGTHGTDGPYDITKILAAHPGAMTQPTSPPWGPMGHFHHWGEPLFGYYFSDDAWVLRKHAQMLADAAADVVIFDVTNQFTYQNVYMELGRVFSEVRRDGGRTPQMAFLCPFWDPPKVVKELYENLYKPGRYADLWFRWKGKPLIMADPDKVDPQYRDFFTFRKPQPDYFKGPTGPNQWGWLEIHPQHVFRNDAGEPEQMTVGIAQNGTGGRLSSFSEKDTYGRSWHNGAKDERPGAVNLGLNFAEQWELALEVDPQFIFITGWNEWVASRFGEFNKVREPVMFVDQFTQEYSRDIEPMKGGHGDAYYYQMIDYIRRYKGARPLPVAGPPKTIAIDGDFEDWRDVRPEYRDDRGDVMHRDHRGYDNAGRYVNRTGRNDFVLLKVAIDDRAVYFHARTAAPITPHTDRQWMQLFIDVDADRKTGWEGYDFVVNRTVKDARTTVLEAAGDGGAWQPREQVRYHVNGDGIELAIPRSALGLQDAGHKLRFDFKWADHIEREGDATEFTVNGDAAPNCRFNYRFQQR